jgi:hypothetical protein
MRKQGFQDLPMDEKREMISALGAVTQGEFCECTQSLAIKLNAASVLANIHIDGVNGDEAIQAFQEQFYSAKSKRTPIVAAKDQSRPNPSPSASDSGTRKARSLGTQSFTSGTSVLKEHSVHVSPQSQGLQALLRTNISTAEHPSGLYASLSRTSSKYRIDNDDEDAPLFESSSQPFIRQHHGLKKKKQHKLIPLQQHGSKSSKSRETPTRVTKNQSKNIEPSRVGDRQNRLVAIPQKTRDTARRPAQSNHTQQVTRKSPTKAVPGEDRKLLYKTLRNSNTLVPPTYVGSAVVLKPGGASSPTSALAKTYLMSASVPLALPAPEPEPPQQLALTAAPGPSTSTSTATASSTSLTLAPTLSSADGSTATASSVDTGSRADESNVLSWNLD